MAAELPRIAIIVMENHEYDEIIGSSEAPFINGLAGRSVLLTSSFAITHPSLPNYLALLGGSTFGIDSDCTDCSVQGRSLVDQLVEAKISWKAYMEGMPAPCFTGPGAGDYAKKHDPFVYFDRVTSLPERCRKVVPLTELSRDVAAGALPSFTWVTPDQCHDMHDCSIAEGDAWVGALVPDLVAALGPGGLLILTFDEGGSSAGCCHMAAGGHIATILTGPGARTGVGLATPADHYSILRLIEDRWHLAHLNKAACPCTPAITGWEA
jgi:phosphatidylinositol-3-phosphatase